MKIIYMVDGDAKTITEVDGVTLLHLDVGIGIELEVKILKDIKTLKPYPYLILMAKGVEVRMVNDEVIVSNTGTITVSSPIHITSRQP